ncbi:MAG: hypothetical protein IT422_26120 [Pirellulaceae bacterium]|nr:hypothetical protein [Pirellulaceae bacterium]
MHRFFRYSLLNNTSEQPEFEDAQLDTLLNPRVLVEVLSETTESNDRGTKWRHDRSLPALRG